MDHILKYSKSVRYSQVLNDPLPDRNKLNPYFSLILFFCAARNIASPF
jgi:hypothetical protein